MARKPKRPPSRSTPAPPAAQALQIARLRKRIQADPPQSLPSYWQLGNEAGQINGMPSRKLADALGLGDATLRQAMKFSQCVTSGQAGQLETAGVPWRGVILWLGVEDRKQSQQLLDRMLNGLNNSTDIRNYIKEHFGKPASPRRYANLGRICEEAQKKAAALADALSVLSGAYAEAQASDPKAIRQVRPLLGKLAQTARQVSQAASAIR